MNTQTHNNLIRAITVACLSASILVSIACAGTQATPRENPPRPTPSSPYPEAVPRNADDALRLALPRITGKGGNFIGQVSSVSYVEATVGQLSQLFPSGLLQAFPPGARAWLFVTYGKFNEVSRDQRGPTVTTSVDIEVEGYPSVWSQLSNDRFDLPRVGTEVRVQRGQVAAIDAVRAPDSAGTCCSLQLDMDPTIAGVQPSLAVGGARDISIDIVLGDNAGNVSAFDVKLIYDDVKLTPLPNRGGLNGNPGFNEIALGAAWNCDLGGSSPDIDPLTGAGHGVALLSCFATGAGASVTSPTVIGTLRLHAAGPVTTAITLREVQFSHNGATEIGSCNPVATRAMTCVGGAITAP